MLVKIYESNLSDTNKVGTAFILGWTAVDLERFAYLYQTAGRGKYGLPKFILVLVVNPTGVFEDFLRAYSDSRWNKISSVVRSWSVEEAIAISNKRLPTMIKRAQGK